MKKTKQQRKFLPSLNVTCGFFAIGKVYFLGLRLHYNPHSSGWVRVCLRGHAHNGKSAWQKWSAEALRLKPCRNMVKSPAVLVIFDWEIAYSLIVLNCLAALLTYNIYSPPYVSHNCAITQSYMEHSISWQPELHHHWSSQYIQSYVVTWPNICDLGFLHQKKIKNNYTIKGLCCLWNVNATWHMWPAGDGCVELLRFYVWNVNVLADAFTISV